MNSYKVTVAEISERTIRGKLWYRVRWSVEGAPKRFEKTFGKKAQANSFRSDLLSATNAGKPFDTETGMPALPPELVREQNAPSWYGHARSYIQRKWPRLSANSRRGSVESLVAVTMLTLRDVRGRPEDTTIRAALSQYGFNPPRWNNEVPDEYIPALAWVEKASTLITKVGSAKTTRRVLDGLCLLLDGMPAAAKTVSRKKSVFYNALEYAVEDGHLPSNPIDQIQWTAPEIAEAIDRRVVANPTQVEQLLDANQANGKQADKVTAFFGNLYYCGTRPSEAADLRAGDLVLPGTCKNCRTHLPDVTKPPIGTCLHENIEYEWGKELLAETEPRAGSTWTDDGRPHQRRGLKHRPRTATREIPVPPKQVALLHRHITKYGVAPDGRLFRGLRGGPLSPSIWGRWWKLARQRAFSPEQVASPLARRPYDLRHAAASLWLNAGVPATEVARRLGNSVKVLLQTYANCVDGDDDGYNDRIATSLG
jgi:integrase